MLKVRPCLVQENQRGRAIEALLYSTEQIQQNRDHRLVVELEEILRFKRQHPPVAQAVVLGIE